MHVALPDWTDDEKTRVNLTKTQQLYSILHELALVQTTPPNIDANTDLLNLLTVRLLTVCLYLCMLSYLVNEYIKYATMSDSPPVLQHVSVCCNLGRCVMFVAVC